MINIFLSFFFWNLCRPYLNLVGKDKIFTDQFSAIMEVNYTSLYELGITLNKNDIILDYNLEDVESVSLTELENENGIYKFALNIEGINVDNFNLVAKINHESFIDYASEINLHKVVELNELEITLNNFKNYITFQYKMWWHNVKLS